MKLTLKDGTVFEGSVTEYVEFLFELNQLAEEEALIKAIEDEEIIEADAVITFEGAKYRKVDREAREGDVVIFHETTSQYFLNEVPYEVITKDGDINAIDEEGDDILQVYNEEMGRTHETVDVYAPVAKCDPTPYEPKIGDIVVVTGNTSFSRNSVGDIGKVYKTRFGNIGVEVPSKPKQKGVNGNSTKPSEIRPATEEEIAHYEKALADVNKTKLKAGDLVVFTDDEAFDNDYFTAEKSYEVKVDEDGDLFVTDDDNNTDYCALDGYKYEILSANNAKWAKLGRGVNEYKVGDIVRLLDGGDGGLDGFNGLLLEVDAVTDYDVHIKRPCDIGDMDVDTYHNFEDIELVAPVEATL